MAYTVSTPSLGFPAITSTDTAVPKVKLGTIVTAVDPTYGMGEFILLLGCASTVVGSVVTYDGASTGTPTYQTVLAPSTAGLGQPLAVAMSINLATYYGWYQISGNMVMATNGTLAAGPAAVYLAGSGQVTSTQANGKAILNARNETATGTPSSGLAVVQGQRISAQGQVV